MTTRETLATGILLAALLVGGCANRHQTFTSPYHPGPVIGQTVGLGIGVVAGNAAGVAVGLTEGAIKGSAAPFDNTTRIVRRWSPKTTEDGRVIQVPVDILVDSNGRPIGLTSASK